MCDKYVEGGAAAALFDEQRKGRTVEITDDAVAWIIDIAYQSLGYSQELWTVKNLHKHIRNNVIKAGYPQDACIQHHVLHIHFAM